MSERISERDKMLSGLPYDPADPELVAGRKRAKQLCALYNASTATLDRAALQELLGYETDAYFEPPFYCDYGTHIRLGRGVYANHNLIVLDCAEVVIGDNVLMGPNVVLTAATHSTDPAERLSGLERAGPITIGNNVWIGANVSVLPGVTIGDNTTIGAGSVVSRPIPANCVAVGNPCRVIKHLDARQT